MYVCPLAAGWGVIALASERLHQLVNPVRLSTISRGGGGI